MTWRQFGGTKPIGGTKPMQRHKTNLVTQNQCENPKKSSDVLKTLVIWGILSKNVLASIWWHKSNWRHKPNLAAQNQLGDADICRWEFSQHQVAREKSGWASQSQFGDTKGTRWTKMIRKFASWNHKSRYSSPNYFGHTRAICEKNRNPRALTSYVIT